MDHLNGTRVMGIHPGLNWMDSIMAYIKDGMLLEDSFKVEKIWCKAPKYWLLREGKLYKCLYTGPCLLCVHPEAIELLQELHDGICGNHTERQTLAHRAITQGYWWPNIKRSSQKYTKKCDQCQRHTPNIHQLGGFLNPFTSSRPFT